MSFFPLSRLRRELEEAQNILQMTGRGNRFSIICAVALALFCAGGSIAILLGNFFLAPVMAVGFLFLPFWYVKLTANHYKRDVSAEMCIRDRSRGKWMVSYNDCDFIRELYAGYFITAVTRINNLAQRYEGCLLYTSRCV